MIWWVMLGFGTVVLVVVTTCWLYAFKRNEVVRTPTEERRVARRWIIGGGIVLPVASITALLAFGVPTGQRLLPLPLSEPPEVIEVIGHQWWWEVRYPGAEGGEVVTSNQLIMPAGEPVDFHVTGADVIHAFWVPRLGGKIDMIPGRVNKIRLEADEPAVFGAQCAEFCGAQHAQMQLYVETVERDEYDAWLAARQMDELSSLELRELPSSRTRTSISPSFSSILMRVSPSLISIRESPSSSFRTFTRVLSASNERISSFTKRV
jgi:cytochrome c oxidase subunit 2